LKNEEALASLTDLQSNFEKLASKCPCPDMYCRALPVSSLHSALEQQVPRLNGLELFANSFHFHLLYLTLDPSAFTLKRWNKSNFRIGKIDFI